MALVIADRVRESSTTTSTGTFVLSGAVVGYQTFSSAIGNGNTTYYTISNPGTTEWEVGIGTVSAGQLARTTVLDSSNGGSLVNFSAGTKDVFVTYPADKAVYLDSSGNVSPLGTVASGTWQGTVITTPYGGTGLSSYTAGDTVYYASGTTLSKLAIGSNKTIMTSSGTAPQWSSSLDTTQGGTGVTSYTTGDLPYYVSGTSLSKLSIGTNGYVLKSDGSAPVWEATSNVAVVTFSAGTTGFTPNSATGGAVTLAGTLNLANGGTGATTVAGAQTNLQVDPAGTAIAMAIALG